MTFLSNWTESFVKLLESEKLCISKRIAMKVSIYCLFFLSRLACSLSAINSPTKSVSGQNLSDYIANGKPANPGEFPYIVAVRFRSAFFCSGILIHPRWALTTRSCI